MLYFVTCAFSTSMYRKPPTISQGPYFFVGIFLIGLYMERGYTRKGVYTRNGVTVRNIFISYTDKQTIHIGLYKGGGDLVVGALRYSTSFLWIGINQTFRKMLSKRLCWTLLVLGLNLVWNKGWLEVNERVRIRNQQADKLYLRRLKWPMKLIRYI